MTSDATHRDPRRLTVNDPTRPRRVLGFLARRWPTAFALVTSALALGAGGSDGSVQGFSEALLILPLVYLIAAKVNRRWLTWPVVVAAIALIVVLGVTEVVAPAAVLVPVALAVLVWGGVRGELHRTGVFRIQALGMVGFGALALIGLAVDPDLGRYLVAAGWFLHSVWDFVHLRLDKVVSRSYAEWCGVFDVMIAVQLVVLF